MIGFLLGVWLTLMVWGGVECWLDYRARGKFPWQR